MGDEVDRRAAGRNSRESGLQHVSGCQQLYDADGSALYAVQIYCDFASYSMIAVGVGRPFGFELVQNFKQPYFARNLTDFWRRWQISLSSWLRDYIYIPLGGGRKGLAVRQRNILLVFSSAVCGMAARLSFGMGTAAWCRTGRAGFYKKAKQAVFGEAKLAWEKLRHMLSVLLTFTVMCFLDLFRSESVSMASDLSEKYVYQVERFCTGDSFCSRWDWKKRSFSLQSLGLQVLLGIDLISEKETGAGSWIYRMPLPVRWAICLF